MQRRNKTIIAAAIVLGIALHFDFFEVGAVPAEAVAVTDAKPAEPNGLTSLDKLDLSGTQMTDADLARRLEGLTSLRELNLRDTQISDAGLAHLKGLTSLRSLNLSRTQVTAKTHPLLGQPLGDLKFTSLKGQQIDISRYKGKVVLVDFWATWCGPCISELPHVKKAYSKYHDEGFEIIGISLDKNRAALEKFIEKNDIPWPQYFDGKGWKNEISTRFDIHSIPSTFLLDGEGTIRYANLRGSALERAVADVLRGPALPSAKITSAGLAHLQGLTSLETLRLENTQVSDEGLAYLEGLTSLRTLYLGDTQVTNAGLVHLSNLTTLESLCVHKTQVSDGGMAHLKDLTGLKYLCLHDTQVTDAGLEYLGGLTALETLYLYNTQVGDAGLTHLKGLSSLQKLNLRGTRVSKAGITELKQALPNCSISEPSAPKPRRVRRPTRPSAVEIPLHLQILIAVIVIPIASLLSAVFLRMATKWAVKFKIPYWTAYKIMIIAAVVGFVIGIPFDAIENIGAKFLGLVVNFLVASAIYGGMIKYPETDDSIGYGGMNKYPETRDSIGFGKGLLISFFFLLIWIVLGLIVGLLLFIVMRVAM